LELVAAARLDELLNRDARVADAREHVAVRGAAGEREQGAAEGDPRDRDGASARGEGNREPPKILSQRPCDERERPSNLEHVPASRKRRTLISPRRPPPATRSGLEHLQHVARPVEERDALAAHAQPELAPGQEFDLEGERSDQAADLGRLEHAAQRHLGHALEHAQALDPGRGAEDAQPPQLDQRDRGLGELPEAIEQLERQLIEPVERASSASRR